MESSQGIDPEDAKIFEGSIANDRSALMVASQFVGVAQPIDDQVSASLLTDIVATHEESLSRIFADKENVLRRHQKEQLEKLISEQSVKEEKLREKAAAELKKLDSERVREIETLKQKGVQLERRIEEMRSEELKQSELNDARLRELEERARKSERRAQLPYFVGLTAVLLVLSNNLGLQNFSSESFVVFGMGLPMWSLTAILLLSLVCVSWFLTSLGSKLFK